MEETADRDIDKKLAAIHAATERVNKAATRFVHAKDAEAHLASPAFGARKAHAEPAQRLSAFDDEASLKAEIPLAKAEWDAAKKALADALGAL